MMQRVQNAVRPQPAPARRRMIALIQYLFGGFDAEHLTYLVHRGIMPVDLLPADMQVMVTTKLLGNIDLGLCTDQEWLAAVTEARPDCRELFGEAAGRAWLKRVVG